MPITSACLHSDLTKSHAGARLRRGYSPQINTNHTERQSASPVLPRSVIENHFVWAALGMYRGRGCERMIHYRMCIALTEGEMHRMNRTSDAARCRLILHYTAAQPNCDHAHKTAQSHDMQLQSCMAQGNGQCCRTISRYIPLTPDSDQTCWCGPMDLPSLFAPNPII